MEQDITVSEQLQELLVTYKFNIEMIASYLYLTQSQVEEIARGNTEFLQNGTDHMKIFQIYNKISFLYYSAVDDKDFKLSAFLGVLADYHHISKETLAKMAGVEEKDVENMLANQPSKLTQEAKYNLAVTTMTLRFFLKELEPEPFS